MKEKVLTISEKTLVPISLVLAVAGGVYSIAILKAQADTASVVALQCQSAIVRIDRRLARIEGHLGVPAPEEDTK